MGGGLVAEVAVPRRAEPVDYGQTRRLADTPGSAELRTFSECLLMACQRADPDIDDRLGVPGRTLTSSRMLQGRRPGVFPLATPGRATAPSTRSHRAVVGTPVDTARHGELQGPGPD